ncbi:phosphoribosylglycinamide formyltransferase [Aliivibrio sp. S4TY2]|uniref:phosphoribosylglycinamide formyltransferase n=1 Tax=unclassified Aliivibrio TaxID=2645654 RepID=UPI002377DEE8|nr:MULTISPECIES: phosphoribosylglycinamide formyltransferase [unclassified Aliivibrio]MDD9154858.1 phosphoribosylglycinamide formyltransferase [Aliivibrio sp. S4TY2]MDD9158779.1 phosphoribosylglycinamide formyltransferase [Aliivibrio sp. S4TY1]MDD9162861.1 phosphoribosylglycinamide formyltransferase [Aliivibrio sp. S4MY2]MDD9166778.1 phosphoribosylglycinamide formyltransferase [Aliivibrio sp. S4MY4]MDD9183938.1 phosphoribosylglycinamide formyltransferase [Aliivibrio sp. S4MY3]
MKNIVVLVSGSGSNLQAFIDACGNKIPNARIAAVISNKSDAYGLQRALNTGINAHSLSAKGYENREQYDQALATLIDLHKPDVIILAGFMRILSEDFVLRYQGKMLNIHPSLLPKYTGLHTHQRAIDAGDKEHGTSVHFVTPELDGGPVILQAKVPIFDNDTAEEVASRVQAQEHVIYPMVAKWLVEERLIMQDGKAILDGSVLGPSGLETE